MLLGESRRNFGEKSFAWLSYHTGRASCAGGTNIIAFCRPPGECIAGICSVMNPPLDHQAIRGLVAQLAEHSTEARKVLGSNPGQAIRLRRSFLTPSGNHFLPILCNSFYSKN